ncbi:hypothetical protein QFZ37_000170 [Chryseobacterium ginsenosidimutans]|uniref:hypothetical protein n=1 Tax=Chryseobacterium ginsenosidimutans TaxID=687846 RepID=UPI002788271F|nr:hypothetical protein [Chryseobacterium ginsenosidimutans]MDQ0591801.1 hypothetical protein [Chryseobacterium ginsenosidimutans]
MANLTLQVTVSGGLADYGITYRLYKKGQLIQAKKYERSFEKTFADLDGKYSLYIYGTGPATDDKKVITKLLFDDSEIDLIESMSSDNPLIETTYEIGGDYYFKTI